MKKCSYDKFLKEIEQICPLIGEDIMIYCCSAKAKMTKNKTLITDCYESIIIGLFIRETYQHTVFATSTRQFLLNTIDILVM